MRPRSTLTLLVIFLALAAYIYRFELRDEPDQKQHKLVVFNKNEVETITLQYPNQSIRFQKEPSGGWSIITPIQTAADSGAVETILTALGVSDVVRTVENGPGLEDHARFGLAAPKIKISLASRGGPLIPTISIGDKTPVGNFVYVRRADQPTVMLSGAELALSFDKALNDFRERRLFIFSPEQVARLTMRGSRGAWTLARNDHDGWSFESPKSGTVPSAKVHDYLLRLAALRAHGFAGSEVGTFAFGSDQPELRIGLDGHDEKSLGVMWLGFSKGDPAAYARREGDSTLYIVEARTIKELEEQLVQIHDAANSATPPPDPTP